MSHCTLTWVHIPELLLSHQVMIRLLFVLSEDPMLILIQTLRYSVTLQLCILASDALLVALGDDPRPSHDAPDFTASILIHHLYCSSHRVRSRFLSICSEII